MSDGAFKDLFVWVDSNNNGVSDAGEMRTLASLGITRLSLETAAGSKKGTFVMNGATKMTQDILLDVKQENSWYMGVKSLHFATNDNFAVDNNKLFSKLAA